MKAIRPSCESKKGWTSFPCTGGTGRTIFLLKLNEHSTALNVFWISCKRDWAHAERVRQLPDGEGRGLTAPNRSRKRQVRLKQNRAGGKTRSVGTPFGSKIKSNAQAIPQSRDARTRWVTDRIARSWGRCDLDSKPRNNRLESFLL